jgi:hypothetical protein
MGEVVMETWSSWGSVIFTNMTHSAQVWLVLIGLLLWWGYDKRKRGAVALTPEERDARAHEPFAVANQTEVHLPQQDRSFWGRKSPTRQTGWGNWIVAAVVIAGSVWAYDAGFGQDMLHILGVIGAWQVISWIVG